MSAISPLRALLSSPLDNRPTSRPRPAMMIMAMAVALCPALVACDDDAQPSIAEVRDSGATTPVTVEGHVSVAPGAFMSAIGDQGFAIQDDTAGIYVKVDEKQAFGLGAHVRVTGTLDEQDQLRVLKAVPADIATLSGTKEVAARDVRTGDVNETVEGSLIRASGPITRAFQDDSPYGYKLYIDDSSGEIQVFVHVSAGLDKTMLQALAVGRRITVVGLAAQYQTTYEIAPRQPSDLVAQ